MLDDGPAGTLIAIGSAMSRQPFPQTGRPADTILDALMRRKDEDADWRSGRLNSLVHYANEDVLQISKAAATAYFSENALGLAAFPSVRQMMTDLGEWVGDLLHAPASAVATVTTGGTESIFLAMKAARDRHLAQHGTAAFGALNIVVPRSAHPAFSKAASYLGLGVRRPPLTDGFQADPQAMEAAIDRNTVLLAASAPAYPHGVIDPVGQIAAMADARGLWLHVDACVGGFTLPFLRALGHPIPAFDFSLPGVTSLSADLHKYGFTAKGCAALVLRDEALHAFQRFTFDDWPRGAYSSDAFSGSRPAGPIASAWSVLQFLGFDGYCRLLRIIMAGRERYLQAVRTVPELCVWGDPPATIFSYGSPELDIHDVSAAMAERGWRPHLITEPKGIHLGQLTPVHAAVADAYAADLAAAVAAVKNGFKATQPVDARYGA